jgi:hypothetical protein
VHALRSNTEALQEQLKSLVRIEEQITMLLKSEIDTIVRSKVQELITGLVRQEADKEIRTRLDD